MMSSSLRKWMICTCRFVVTTMIVGAGLWGKHVRNLVTVHNCPHWGALHIMNVGEKEEAKLQANISVAIAGNFWNRIGSLGLQIASEGYSLRVGGYSEITWDNRAFKVKESLIWKLTLVWPGVILGGCGVTGLGTDQELWTLSGRLSIAWTRVTIFMRVNFWPLQMPLFFLLPDPAGGKSKGRSW